MVAGASGIDGFIERWRDAEGSERALSQPFLIELCDALGLDRPGLHPDYEFEYAVRSPGRDEPGSTNWIDLYRRGSFVLESKQSRQRGGRKAFTGEEPLPGLAPPPEEKPRDRASRAWDTLMMNARKQAEGYARALPPEHGWPPFVITCDVGYCFELYADFSGQGKYRQFPDRQGFRVHLEDFRRPATQSLFRAIWMDPGSLDPTARAARATRGIARRLAEVSKALEGRGADPEQAALFLMRCLFTMFAEDVGLLPRRSFRCVLEKCEADPTLFPHKVQQLWQAMNSGGFAHAIEAKVKCFNGKLFADATVFDLRREELGELKAAASADWREVEPAIFGTLLEQALDPLERKRLGAHYTPRAYVERLVNATVIEPLSREWTEVQATADRLLAEGRSREALARVQGFHDKLCDTRVLDPACGTGNFLYVALELMKRLEGEVLEAVASLGGQESLRELEGHTVDPHQFLGLEINPRAVAIAELVLWIGYLQWHFRTRGGPPSEPILRRFQTIEQKDAVLDWDGYPLARVVDGKETYPNPRRPEWPEADYIVGNPPFIGGKDIRSRLGDARAEALWAAHPQMNESADFVLYWWDRAAELLNRGSRLKRFGLVTTNSISQVFQRRVVERHLKGKHPVSLLLAVPDHPWTKATRDAAAVRIAMTVAAAGGHEGCLRDVLREDRLDTDEPLVELDERRGRINADLTVGVDLSSLAALRANEGLCSRGMALHGGGFIVTPAEAERLGLGARPGLERHIRPYRNGRDLTSRPRGVMVIDLLGLDAEDVRSHFPEVYQHLLRTVRPQRERNNRASYREAWWIFGEPRRELRPALAGLSGYIATVETARHRIFQFLDAAILPDNMLVNVGSADAFHLGVLSSRLHVLWALRAGGWLGMGNDPRYTKSRCFDPFPLPDPDPSLRRDIASLAEEIDALRKDRQARTGVTLTQIYNVLEKLKAAKRSPDGAQRNPGSGLHPGHGDVRLAPDEVRIQEEGLVLVLKELHEKLDAAVARAYGWPADLPEEDILARLVALNRERAREEARGRVRWLRPEYQIPRFGSPSEQRQIEADLTGEALGQVKSPTKPSFPKDAQAQTAAVIAMLTTTSRPLCAADIAAAFRQGAKARPRVESTLAALARQGYLTTRDGRSFAWLRAA